MNNDTDTNRRFGVRWNGHGFKGAMPTDFTMTLAEAEEAVRDWECFADTIGGSGDIFESPT